jgi:16S rRNA G966 N2-methylase RsmD
MEKDSNAQKILKSNIALMDPSKCEVLFGDSFLNIATIVKYLQKTDTRAYFYIDPPFSIREGMEDIYDKMILMIKSLPNEIVKMIIIEHMSQLKLPKEIGNFSLKKSKKFGKTTLSYFQNNI